MSESSHTLGKGYGFKSPSAALLQPREKLFWELRTLSSCFPFAAPNVQQLPLGCLQQRRERKEKLFLGTPLHGSQMGCDWVYSRTSKTMSHYYTINCSRQMPQTTQVQDWGGAQMCQLAAGLRGLCTIQVRTDEVQHTPITIPPCPSVSPLTIKHCHEKHKEK